MPAPIQKAGKDFSVNLTDSIAAALKARSTATGKSAQEIARKVLQEWADSEHHAYTVYARELLANDRQTVLPGLETVSDGLSRGVRR